MTVDSELVRGSAVGRYLVLERIGDGAMGVVYAAYDPELDRKLALKLIRPELAGEAAAARLLGEGRAIARLAHPNVVSVFDLGRHAGGVFVAMELVDGMSLAGWLGERAWPWQEVLAVFRQAGAGLAAAHAAGIVHRDFKPVNVLVGDDGRVRVGDFGLARLDVDGDPAPRSSDAEVAVTQSVVAGTPAYMAPEQFEGRVDAQSDQFSFAVALWEALYGERPYPGSSVLEIAASIVSTRPTAPAASKVPSRVRDALLRALEREPAARFPSMTELLAALAPRSRLPRGWPIALALASAGIAVILATRLTRTDEVCAGAGDELRGVWDVERRAELARAFAGVGKSYAPAALAEVQRAIDAYAHEWTAMKTESCTATVVRHVQTEEHQGLRDVCFAERLVDLKALVDVLAQADADAVARGPQAVARLQPLEMCANLRALAQATPAPSMRAAPLDAMFAAADALAEAGKFDRAYALATQAAADAKAIGAHRAAGRALQLAGFLAHRRGNNPGARAMLDDAIDEAEIAHDDRTAAHAWVTLVAVVGTGLNHFDEALAIARHASAAIDRAGGIPLERARLDAHRGRIFMVRRQFTEALAAFESAQAIRSRVLAPDDLGNAESLDDLGEVYDHLDRFADAAAANERVVALRERKLGPDHPDLAIAYLDLGRVRQERNDYSGAEVAYRKAAGIAERALGPAAPALGDALFRLSNVLHDASAEPTLERAIAIFEKTRDLIPLAGAYQVFAVRLARRNDYARAEHELDLAEVVNAELGRDPEAGYWIARAEVYTKQRRYDRAEDAIRHALAFDERVYGKDSSSAATDHGYLGRLFDETHQYEQALGEHVLQLSIEERVYGKEHALLSVPLTNIGLMLGQLGRYAQAIPYFTRAVALDEKAFGKTSGDLAVELWGLADALEHLGRHDQAIAVLERGLGLDNAAAAEEPYANTQLTLAIALANTGRDRGRAVKLATDARTTFAKLRLAKELAQSDRWLASHR